MSYRSPIPTIRRTISLAARSTRRNSYQKRSVNTFQKRLDSGALYWTWTPTKKYLNTVIILAMSIEFFLESSSSRILKNCGTGFYSTQWLCCVRLRFALTAPPPWFRISSLLSAAHFVALALDPGIITAVQKCSFFALKSSASAVYWLE